MRKRVAILTPVIPPYVGGIGKAALAEAEMLAAEFDVTIFTPKYSYISNAGHREGVARGDLSNNEWGLPRPDTIGTRNDDTVEGQHERVKIKYIKPFFAFGNAAILTGLKNELQNFDIVYLHYPFFGTAEFFGVKNKELGIRHFVVRYHMDVVGMRWMKPLFWFHSKLIMPRILKKAKRIIISSFDYARNSNIKKLFKKYPEKFVEIPFGVDTEKFKPEPKDKNLLECLNLKPSDKILMFVGGLDRAHYFKGMDVLLRAAKELRTMNQESAATQRSYIPDSKFYILVIGDGDLRPHYENLARNLGIFDQLRFVGKVSNEDLPIYYNLTDIFVFPSVDRSEAFGIALLEAMACGKAVVASNLPGVRTLVKDGVNGRSVIPGNTRDLAEKIEKAFVCQHEFGARSRQIVEGHFAAQKINPLLLDAFASS